MNLVIKRTDFTAESTIGELYVDGVMECYTLEDVVRDNGVKIYGQTAIPSGTYRVVLSFSNRFQKVLPELLDVPNYTGVRIHSGNSPTDTQGCILTGVEKSQNTVIRSREALNHLIQKLQSATVDIILTIS